MDCVWIGIPERGRNGRASAVISTVISNSPLAPTVPSKNYRAKRALGDPIVEYIQKPFAPAELARKIEGIISKRRSREREEPQEN